MPLFFQQDIDDNTKLAIWKIEEEEGFFHVPLQRDITHPHKRLQHLAGRYLLKYLFPDFPTQLIRIADTRKPFLEDEKYHFSISHCGDFAAVIVSSKSRVGIDVEVISDKPARIMHKFLNEEERDIASRETSNMKREFKIMKSQKSSVIYRDESEFDIKSNAGSTEIDGSQLQTPNPKLLTLFWSAKEAMFKWWGNGKVDFSEMLHLSEMNQFENGIMKGRFLKDPFDITLPVHFKIFDGIVMAWVKTDPGVFEK